MRPVIEAIRAGRRAVHEVQLPPAGHSAGLRELAALVADRGIPSTPARGRTVVARADPYPEEPWEGLLDTGGERLLVALDGVTDVGNLGSIARTCEVSGVTGLVLEYRRAPPVDTGALRASAGALEYLRVGRTPALHRALDLCRDEGFEVLVAEPQGQSLDTLPPGVLRGDLVWVFGAEDRGTRPAVRDRASYTVGIPSGGNGRGGHVGSLGVAAAAAYLLLRTADHRRRPA